jgi:hypothetical protein
MLIVGLPWQYAIAERLPVLSVLTSPIDAHFFGRFLR